MYLKQCKCKCGKGECVKCGGVNNLDGVDAQKKKLISDLIKFLQESSKTPNNDADEEELNKLLLGIDKSLVECTGNSRNAKNIDPIFRVLKINESNKDNYTQFTDNYETRELSKHVERTDMFNKDSFLNSVTNEKNEEYELIGFITGDNVHFISYVKYENGWYERDSKFYNNSTKNQTIYQPTEIEKIIDKQFKNFINEHTRGLCYVLYRNMEKTKLKNRIPPIFKQFENICYMAAPLQLLCATNLLDDTNSEAQQNKDSQGLFGWFASIVSNTVSNFLSPDDKASAEAKAQAEARAKVEEEAKAPVDNSKENKKSIPFTSGLPISDPIDPKIIENYRVRQAISIASRQQSKNVSNSPFEEYLKKK